ncbi:MAG: aldehyde dehydrogenase family protein [Planctomycetes bacterium]|nr:aldehyde dehydrogenase family protein [Planctomycetota bacterium]
MNKIFIDGKWGDSESGQVYLHRNPADLTRVTGTWPKSTVKDTRAAIDAAQNAFESWSRLNVFKRAEYLKKAVQIMSDRGEEIASLITLENGKILAEARGEVNAAINEAHHHIAEGLRVVGPHESRPVSQDGMLAFAIRRPLGVAGIITPWNFPFNVASRKMFPALIAGCTGVLKPAQLTPGASAALVKLFEEAGLPPGVVNFVTGSGSVAGEELVTNPAVKAISFTGSTEVGTAINAKAGATMTRTQLEMGGKNATVVLADANLEKAVEAICLVGYLCSGQLCTSTSRVIVEKKVYDQLLDLMVRRVKKMVVGVGSDPKTTMGPVCGEQQMKDILAGLEKAKREGARLASGGNRLTGNGLDKGCFIEPTVLADVRSEMFIAQEEVFGPIISVMPVNDFDEAIEVMNNVKYGLSSSIYTNDMEKALTFIEKADVGLAHVNLHTAAREPQFSLAGVKMSGFGIPESGHTGIEFFTEHKVAYIKYRL